MRTYSRKLLLLCVLFFVFLFILPSSGKKNRRRNQRKKSDSSSTSDAAASSVKENDKSQSADGNDDPFQSDETVVDKERGSRRREDRKGRRRKNMPILKTSVRAKMITEKKYLKKDWCKSQPVRQHVQTSTNCHGVVINQFCYGQCNSFYIPKDIVIDADQHIEPGYFKSCSFCKPKTLEWITVRLRCKNVEDTRMPRFITKKIKRVKGCTCIAVPDLEKSSDADVEIIGQESSTSDTLVLATAEPNR